MEKYHCPVCHQSENSKVFLKGTYEFTGVDDLDFSARPIPNHAYFTFRKCKQCGALFVENALTFDELEAIYTNSSFDEKDEGCQASETYARYAKMKVHGEKGKAMDIGASEGSFLAELIKLGYTDVSGVEPTLAAIEKADPSIKDKMIHAMFDAKNFPENSYDLISFFQVIEHVSEPKEVLTGIRNLLKEDGHVFIVGHNYTSLVNRLMGRKSPIYCLGHLQIFSPKSVRKMMEDIGYSDIEVFRITNRYELSYWVKLSPLPLSFKKHLLNFITKLKIDKKMVSIPGSNMGIVAKK